MKYFFILGNNPDLSYAEINSILTITGHQPEILEYNSSALVIRTSKSIDCPALMQMLGGTIKLGEINIQLPKQDTAGMADNLVDHVPAAPGKKIMLGLSFYGMGKLNTKALGMEIKTLLKARGANARLVVSREPTLSSVVIEQNKLLSQGAEIVIIENQTNKNNLYVGITKAIQPFKALSFRDFNRPARDDKSGMIPPKLAQIMINLAQAPLEGVILDPFCGSGTILMEAALMGYDNLIGSDISGKAYTDTKTNIRWLEENFKFQIANFKQLQISATEISKKLPAESIDAIVTEPYLGPQRGFHRFDEVARELNKLYSEAINQFYKVLKPEGRIVMIWPIMRSKDVIEELSPDIHGFEIESPLPPDQDIFKTTKRKTIIYGRDDQKVWREIVILKKSR